MDRSGKIIRNFAVTAMAFVMAVLLFLVSACGLLGPAEVTVNMIPDEAEMTVGERLALAAVASDGSPLFWCSSDEHIAVVDNEGLVEALSPGEVRITAYIGDAEAACEITVHQRDDAYVSVSPRTAELVVGDVLALYAAAFDGSDVQWRSEDNAVATVSEEGVVTAEGVGQTRIVAYGPAGEGFCTVTVSAKQGARVIVSPQSAEIKLKETLRLHVNVTDGTAVQWRSENAEVATVSSDGLVTAVGVGQTRIVAYGSAGEGFCTVTVSRTPTPKDSLTLAWSDEFSGTSLDESKWEYQEGIRDYYGNSEGPEFWGNNEQQYYTRDAVSVEYGNLVITAARRDMPNGRRFSSARITTRDRYSFTYGYAEIRMQTPAITGMWPAFWALPQPLNQSSTNNVYGGWPASGEIDIMEAKGREQNVAGTTLHFGPANPGSWQSVYRWKDTVLSSSTEEWHTYGLEWTADYMAWWIDDEQVFRLESREWYTQAVRKAEKPAAPFDVDFYLLVNLAVGGNFDGGREPPETFTAASMLVDYVRVYR